MSKTQFIETESGEQLVVLSRRDYDALLVSRPRSSLRSAAGVERTSRSKGH